MVYVSLPVVGETPPTDAPTKVGGTLTYRRVVRPQLWIKLWIPS